MSFKIIIITPPASLKNEIKVVCTLFNSGLRVLHLRKPGFSKKELTDYLSEVPAKFHKKIVIHSHYSLLDKFDLGGMHLTGKTRRKKLSTCFNKKKHTLSASFHTSEGISNSKRKYDYVFLSPVFNSISKKGYKSSFTEIDLYKLLKKNKNVIALGGITPETIKKTKSLDFMGAASLGFIWENKDPLKAYKQLISKIK